MSTGIRMLIFGSPPAHFAPGKWQSLCRSALSRSDACLLGKMNCLSAHSASTLHRTQWCLPLLHLYMAANYLFHTTHASVNQWMFVHNNHVSAYSIAFQHSTSTNQVTSTGMFICIPTLHFNKPTDIRWHVHMDSNAPLQQTNWHPLACSHAFQRSTSNKPTDIRWHVHMHSNDPLPQTKWHLLACSHAFQRSTSTNQVTSAGWGGFGGVAYIYIYIYI